MRKSILILIILNSLLSFASKKDSLLSVINKGSASEQVKTLIRLEQEYRNNQPDSALYYANLAYKLALENKLDTVLCSVYNSLAITFKLKGNYDTTLFFFEESLDICKKLNDSLGMSTAYNNLGIYYDDIGEISKALELFFKSIELGEQSDNKEDMALSYNNIGLIYYKNEDFDQAKKYYNKSLAIKEELKDSNGMALLYNNIGILFYYENKVQECIDYFKLAAEIWSKSNNTRGTAMVYTNIGELYYEIGIYQSAMNYLIESKDIYTELQDVSGELYALNILGQVYTEWGDEQKAIKVFKEALEKAQKIDAKYEMVSITSNLFDIYQKKKDYKQANYYLLLNTQVEDSVNTIEKEKTIQELNTKYETEKKEQEIKLLNNKDKLNQAQINRQKLVNTSLIIGVFLVLIVVGLFIRQNKIRKQANELLLLKNEEIQQQHAEISEQKNEIEAKNVAIEEKNEELNQLIEEITAQRDKVESQRDQIQQIHKHVSQSIDYAERIQNSTLPNKKILKDHLSDFFVFFLPRDIVSGDFYWWTHVENHTIITAADSTGHGVPGAFMSMLGMSFLKEIIVKEYVTHPGVILRKMRKEIINTLKQKGEIGEQKDGMDMALISINHLTNKVQFAGANNPLYIIRANSLTVESKMQNPLKVFESREIDTPNKLYEIRPDKMPISIYDRMDRFTTHEIQLEEGDQLYMFSDGFADQFGGPKGKKFKYKAFKRLLLENSQKPMQKQKEILSNTFKLWKGEEEQVDDVVVVGIRI